ncbi:site-specific integrase [Halalkalibacter alkaliphilus]|uniref:Site-specific integrase n=1 Tax=Halalkalibacter alkaliphilus TaxID=2917993 RepID=A0A9X2CRW8_9BACI|nr:site-specific integrase [Halalkalibacter alkaliphilus]MCL7747047.1 site-specific integrase [Halalkalibacter alkaliphilus]
MSIIETEVEIDIDVFSDEEFQIEESVNEAKKIIDRLVVENRWIKGDFEDDYWEVTQIQYNENFKAFDFNLLDSAAFNPSLPLFFKEMVKCWIVNLIDKYKKGATTSLILFLKGFELTKGFKVDKKITLLKFIEHSDYSNKYKVDMINSICNFFDYTDIEIADDYVPSLVQLKSKIPYESNIRQLPPSKYVLSFSYYLEKHFDKVLDEAFNEDSKYKEVFLIFPLIIWWRLTNVIPIRPTEFCLIKRDCISDEGGKYYIRLPRNKLKNTKRIQIPDKLLIDEEMYELIKLYIELTNRFGHTDTLISYRSIIHGGASNRAFVTKNLNQFKSLNLDRLIKRFYKVMETKYACQISKEYQVLPNDTRHFAFVSLMMQGYSPVEIARLGGHQTIKAQYHYSGHTEYWVDCEVFRLMKKIKNSKIVTMQTGTIPDEVKLKAYDYNNSSFKRKMKVGHCKDVEQRCESKLCYFCSHWGISTEEYIENKEKIRSDILAKKNNINELTATIRNINKQIVSDELSRRDSGLFNKVRSKSNALQSEIYKLALLCSKLGGGEVLDGEQVRWS